MANTTKMTNKEARKIYEGMKEYFGDKLAHCEHHPRMFQAQMNMYKHALNLRAEQAKIDEEDQCKQDVQPEYILND